MTTLSVLMPSYNSAKYLAIAIESVQKQLLANDELVIQDGESTDGTFEILAASTDARVKVKVRKRRRAI